MKHEAGPTPGSAPTGADRGQNTDFSDGTDLPPIPACAERSGQIGGLSVRVPNVEAVRDYRKKSGVGMTARNKPSKRKKGKPGFYSDGFTEEELELVAAFEGDLPVDEEIWMQRVMNRRLLRQASPPGPLPPPLRSASEAMVRAATGTTPAPASGAGVVSRGEEHASGEGVRIGELVKIAEALGMGTGRIARLLRTERALTGEAGDSLAKVIAIALDEVGTELGLEV